jgi:endonuclease/exonuclease/phosphatase family metal-dependent hydrolase
MKILSLNAWGGRLHDRLIPYLTATDPDVLCLQEVVNTPAAEQDWLVYRDMGIELPQRANLFRDVSQALPNHKALFCPAARGDLFEGDRAFASEWGLATFVRRTFPIIGQAQNFIHGDFSADGYGAHPRSRTAHAVRIYDDGSSSPISVAHMHGLRDLSGKEDTPLRDQQAQAFAEVIQSVARKGERLIVCGDFNVLPSSSTLVRLRQLGLIELVTSRGYAGTRTSFYKKPGRHADYMLVNSQVDIRAFDVVQEPEVSDHCALLLEIN